MASQYFFFENFKKITSNFTCNYLLDWLGLFLNWTAPNLVTDSYVKTSIF